VDRAGEVHPQERELGIGHRVDQAADQAVALWAQKVVLAAEGDDLHLGVGAGQPRDHVRVQPGAIDQLGRRDGVLTRADGETATPHARDRADRKVVLDRDAAGDEIAPEGGRDLAVVHDGGVGRVDAGHRPHVRLDLAHAAGVDQAEPRHAVGRAPLVEGVQPRHLLLRGGDDDLAAAVVLDRVRLAEVHHQAHALHAQAGLEGAGLVVDAGVDDAAVVAGLVPAELGFLLAQHEFQRRKLLEQRPRRGQPDDPAADDGDVVGHRADIIVRRFRPHRSRSRPSVSSLRSASPTPATGADRGSRRR
jgi:hypothetical protein